MTTPQKIQVAVAVSGGGRSLKNLIETQQSDKPWHVAAVISSSPDCRAIAIAREHKLPVFIGDFGKATRPSTAQALEIFLKQQNIDWIVLAGFLKLFPSLLGYGNRVINIHPALLPKFGGKGMHGHHVHEAVIAAKEPLSGATVHFVNERYDEGACIAQVEVPVLPEDSPDQLAARVFAAECKLLPWTLTELCCGRLPVAHHIKKFPVDSL